MYDMTEDETNGDRNPPRVAAQPERERDGNHSGDRPRVFVVEPPRTDMDLTPAEEFGDVVVVFSPPPRRGVGVEPNRRTFRPSVFDAEAFGRCLLEQLAVQGYRPDYDYLMLTGAVLSVSIAFASLAVQYGRFKTLAYNSAMSRYVEKDFDVNNVRLVPV